MIATKMIALKTLTVVFFALVNSSQGRKGFGPGEQEWGYVTVRPKAHMFWWLYYTTANVSSKYEEKPLIIWLQGGPGVSGTAYGNFEELGPLNTKLLPRNHTWVKDYNILFIDNPVGTGFSYVDSNEYLSTNNKQIAKDLFQCIRGFYSKFPKFAETPVFILAESYGGKMTVELANIWYQAQFSGHIDSNLKGIALVDSYISGDDMCQSWAPYLYNFGLIDTFGYKTIAEVADKYVNAARAEKWIDAHKITLELGNLIQNLTYHVDLYNVIKKVDTQVQSQSMASLTDDIYSKDLLKIMEKVKSTLGLTNTWVSQSTFIVNALIKDVKKPVVEQVERLLNETNLKVFVLNGQLDLIINTPGTLNWIRKMKWKHVNNWLEAPMKPLVVNNLNEGYSKAFGNFKFYNVLRSGHMIPADNPYAMKPILRDLIYNE